VAIFSCNDPELIEIPDTTAPTIELTNPISDQLISDDIHMSALTNDDVGIERVEFFVDDYLVRTLTHEPWEYQWTTVEYMDGQSHVFYAKAYDLAGNSGSSDTISVSSFSGWVYDIEGKAYLTIQIGDQLWMAENLSVSKYQNGDSVLSGLNDSLWASTSFGSLSENQSVEDYSSKYGYLYNWYVVNDSRKIAPEGWHVPSEDEWRSLIEYYGGFHLAGGKLKDSSNRLWNNSDSDSINVNPFAALPGGRRHEDGGYFGATVGSYGFYWTSSEDSEHLAWFMQFAWYTTEISHGHYDKRNGFSIRCVKD